MKIALAPGMSTKREKTEAQVVNIELGAGFIFFLIVTFAGIYFCKCLYEKAGLNHEQ